MHIRTSFAALLPLLFAALADACGNSSYSVADLSLISQQNNQARSLSTCSSIGWKIVIDNVRVFDGLTIRNSSTVVIDGDKISSNAAGATERIDGQGGVLLPGFIESHAHPQTMEHLRLLTSHGITTAFHMACYSAEHCSSMQGHPGLVDIHWGSSPAAAPGSQVGNVIMNLTSDSTVLVHDEEDAQRWFDQQLERSPSFFKLIASNPGLSQETLKTLVQLSHDQGRTAVCHAADLASHHQAYFSGANQIHHMPLDVSVDQGFAQQVFLQGQVSVPTLSMMRAFADLLGANYTAASESLRIYHEAQVPILAGTDANSETIARVPFGSSFHNELELMVEAGLSTVDALRSATVLPAHHWGLDDRGVITPGMRADLVLVGGDPIQNISALRDIRKVWVAGIEHEAL